MKAVHPISWFVVSGITAALVAAPSSAETPSSSYEMPQWAKKSHWVNKANKVCRQFQEDSEALADEFVKKLEQPEAKRDRC